MAQGRREPRTEEEARDLKRFLERGADVKLEEQRTINPRRVAERSVEFETTPAEVSQLIKDPATDRVIVELELHNVGSSSDAPLQVFLNKSDADPEAGAKDPAFIGTIAFFVHTDAAGGAPAERLPDQHSYKVRFNATEAVRNLDSREPLTVTLIPLPSAIERSRPSKVAIRSAKLEVSKSRVDEAS